MLRDVLRLHPRLEAPEETHFYRWSYPFKSPRYRELYATNAILKEHRELDGISDGEFFTLYELSRTRRDLQDAYMRLYLEKVARPDARWFDKTPQNAVGMPLLLEDYPDARFIHIHRHPLNVIASLKRGQVMRKHSVDAGINFWLEYVRIARSFVRSHPECCIEVGYQEVVEKPHDVIGRILEFVGEDPALLDLGEFDFRNDPKSYRRRLSREEIVEIIVRCNALMGDYGYQPVLDRIL